jgi:hypothetical protein
MKRPTRRPPVPPHGLLGAALPGSSSESPQVGELERLRAIKAVIQDLRETLAYLEQTVGRVSRMRPPRFKKPGAASATANAVDIAFKCIQRALESLDRAEAGGALCEQYLELAQRFSWTAAVRAGGAAALNSIALPGPRQRSRTAHLKVLLAQHTDLSVAKVNALLSVPLDDATARRIAREHRGTLVRSSGRLDRSAKG